MDADSFGSLVAVVAKAVSGFGKMGMVHFTYSIYLRMRMELRRRPAGSRLIKATLSLGRLGLVRELLEKGWLNFY